MQKPPVAVSEEDAAESERDWKKKVTRREKQCFAPWLKQMPHNNSDPT